MNIESNETIEGGVVLSEEEQYWIKDLFNTNKAWLEMNLPNGLGSVVSTNFVPIRIIDLKQTVRKNTGRYQYLTKIKFAMSNENITHR